jgi:outer membrane protein assembly factor BamB
MRSVVQLIIGICVVTVVHAEDPTGWRGPLRNGVYPETGLLKEWPSNGPEMMWSYQELGQGHSSAAVSGDFLYVSGMQDRTGYLFKFDLMGGLVYKKPYGPEFSESYYGTRGTPVIAGDRVYLLSGLGKLVCMSAASGDILWNKELFREFDGRNISWGLNETPVVDGDVIYITPGGRRNNVVALNRMSGELLWSSPGRGELSAYCTPLLFEHNGRKILATHTASHLIGLDARTGKLLWSQRHPNQWSVHPNTPIYHNGELFFFSGYGQGGGKLKLNADGSSVSLEWTNKDVDSRLGGAVLVDGYIYVSGDYNREWRCIDWETGKEMYSSTAIGKGVVIYADGMLYCYSDRGELALVEADPSGFKVRGKTRVTLGSEQHWAHPMIHDFVFCVGGGSCLIRFEVRS